MKALIIAPFWRQPGHVGVYRIDRFIRWLSEAGIQIVLVRAGNRNEVTKVNWGTEITIEDPLKMFPDPKPGATVPVSNRKPNRLRRMLSFVVFNPDPTVLWCKRIASHDLVLKHCNGVNWVLSSSPPESSHLASSLLAKRLNAQLIVDMRDGWLDEPFKPLLCASRIQRWREGRLEGRILRQAYRIFVTSDVWKELLTARLHIVEDKVTVLTNGCPIINRVEKRDYAVFNKNEKLTLIYSGRFTGSRQTQKVKCLLEPLYYAIKNTTIQGRVILIGSLEPEDLNEVDCWRSLYDERNWNIELRPQVSREDLFPLLAMANGLLLLSISNAAIPSKLFEYLVVQKPILAITLYNSAVWQISERISSVHVVDPQMPDSDRHICDFLSACQRKEHQFIVPAEFCESSLAKTFLKSIDDNS